MRVLVLGGSGYIGARLCTMLSESGWAVPVSGSRRAARGIASVTVDSTDLASMKAALQGMDAVVNCVAGSADAIAKGAQVLLQAAEAAGCRRIVHMSTMSVYGALEGEIDEDSPRDPSIGWYAKAKCEAEDVLRAFSGSLVMLRPGCVWGPGSELWVGRIGRLLQARRLGDLGAAGDGWSNLVAVEDVCAAVLASLKLDTQGTPRVYNLGASDSPRWNDYFIGLALAIGATPVPRLSARRLKIDAKLGGPPLKIAEILARKAGVSVRLPDPLPPGLLGVFERHLHLRSELAERELGLRWTPYRQVLQQAAQWFGAAHATPVNGSTAQRIRGA
jgi:nucleoside-diphosphate-sugar epimerase